MYENISKCLTISQNVWKYIQMYENVSKCMKIRFLPPEMGGGPGGGIPPPAFLNLRAAMIANIAKK
jgi:hypothetical protein